MEILEFGNKEGKKIVFIHGFQTPYQIWNDYIKHYSDKFHIIVPILPGHNPDKKEEFISFDNCALEIEDYCFNKNFCELEAVYGLSMGGIVAAKLLMNKKIKIKYLFFESTPLVGCSKFLTKMLTKNYLKLTHQVQNDDPKTIKRATTSIITPDKLNYFLDMMKNMNDIDIKSYLKAVSQFKLPSNLDVGTTKIYYFYGTKINEMLAKKTVSFIKKHKIYIQPVTCSGQGHCETFIFESYKKMELLDYILIKNIEI